MQLSVQKCNMPAPPPYPVAQMHTRCVMASFLSNLSWHDDNKIQMYQASEEVRVDTDCEV